MKAVVIRTFGDPDGLEVVDVPVPVPAPGQVRIATEAIGVGGVDAVIRRGTFAAYGFREGHLLGSGVAGRVRGAAGGIGITAVPLAARNSAGAVAVTTSSAERGARLRDLGATHVLDRSGE